MAEHTGKSGTGRMWAILLFIIIIAFTNVVGMLAGQLNDLLSVFKYNLSAIVMFVIIVAIFRMGKGNS